jgi:hypothetical protein
MVVCFGRKKTKVSFPIELMQHLLRSILRQYFIKSIISTFMLSFRDVLSRSSCSFFSPLFYYSYDSHAAMVSRQQRTLRQFPAFIAVSPRLRILNKL